MMLLIFCLLLLNFTFDRVDIVVAQDFHAIPMVRPFACICLFLIFILQGYSFYSAVVGLPFLKQRLQLYIKSAAKSQIFKWLIGHCQYISVRMGAEVTIGMETVVTCDLCHNFSIVHIATFSLHLVQSG
jgi:hypothetical protein